MGKVYEIPKGGAYLAKEVTVYLDGSAMIQVVWSDSTPGNQIAFSADQFQQLLNIGAPEDDDELFESDSEPSFAKALEELRETLNRHWLRNGVRTSDQTEALVYAARNLLSATPPEDKTAENERHLARLRELDGVLQKKDERIAYWEASWKQVCNQLDRLAERNVQLEAEVENMRLKVETAQNAAEYQEELNTKLRERLNDARAGFVGDVERLRAGHGELADALDEVARRRQKLVQAEEENAELGARLNDAQERITLQYELLTKRDDRVRELDDEVCRLRSLRTVDAAEIHTLKERIAELEDDCRMVEGARADFAADAEQLREERMTGAEKALLRRADAVWRERGGR